MTYVDFATTFSLTTPLDLNVASRDRRAPRVHPLRPERSLRRRGRRRSERPNKEHWGGVSTPRWPTPPSCCRIFSTPRGARPNLKTKYIQSFYFLGLPLSGYANPYVSQETQSEPGNDLIVQVSDELKSHFGMKETLLKSPFQSEATFATTANERVKVYWFSQPVMEKRVGAHLEQGLAVRDLVLHRRRDVHGVPHEERADLAHVD